MLGVDSNDSFGSVNPFGKIVLGTTLCCVGASFLIFWLTSACQTSCGNNNQQPILYKDGKTHIDGTWRVYESTPYNGEWLDFPSYRRFQLVHNLCTVDYTPVMYIAFSSNPVPANSDAGDVAIASGDVALMGKPGSKQLQIAIDTCSEQYLYVRITAPVVAGDAGLASDASTLQ